MQLNWYPRIHFDRLQKISEKAISIFVGDQNCHLRISTCIPELSEIFAPIKKPKQEWIYVDVQVQINLVTTETFILFLIKLYYNLALHWDKSKFCLFISFLSEFSA